MSPEMSKGDYSNSPDELKQAYKKACRMEKESVLYLADFQEGTIIFDREKLDIEKAELRKLLETQGCAFDVAGNIKE